MAIPSSQAGQVLAWALFCWPNLYMTFTLNICETVYVQTELIRRAISENGCLYLSNFAEKRQRSVMIVSHFSTVHDSHSFTLNMFMFLPDCYACEQRIYTESEITSIVLQALSSFPLFSLTASNEKLGWRLQELQLWNNIQAIFFAAGVCHM